MEGRTDPDHYPDPTDRASAGYEVGRQMVAEGKIHPDHYYGTISCNGVNGAGDVCGAAGSTGRGEANLYNLASFPSSS